MLQPFPDEYPNLAAFVTSTSCSPATTSATIRYGLDLILDGLERRRYGSRAPAEGSTRQASRSTGSSSVVATGLVSGMTGAGWSARNAWTIVRKWPRCSSHGKCPA